jgi:hypothetical protein
VDRPSAALAAVGRLSGGDDAACVCIVADAGGGRALGFLEPDGSLGLARPPVGRDLLAAVIAWFEESLADPPPELEATHEDLAAAVRWLADATAGEPAHRLLAEACDAIDDGLAEDVVVRRLSVAAGAMRADEEEQADWVDLLVARYGEVRGAERRDRS